MTDGSLFDEQDRETFAKAVETWGIDAQAEMAEEECTELTLSSKHWARGKAEESDFVEELADVRIMYEQLTEFLGRDRVERKVREKMDRLRERLEEAESEPGCPGCGHPGDGADILANGQKYCPNSLCAVVSFGGESRGE